MGLVAVGVWAYICNGIGSIGALIEDIIGYALLGGFIFWCFSTFFTNNAWYDFTIAWWGIILGGLYGLYLAYQENKYLI